VRIASVTKMFTSAAVLRLVEQRKIDVDDGIETLVSPDIIHVLRHGGYPTALISVRQLLQHTSGLYDWGSDPRYDATVFAAPGRRWTRIDQVRWAVENGSPVAPPGRLFHYSDTGYIVLGEILERMTGLPLAAAYRALLPIEDLGLASVYLESAEDVPSGAAIRASQYAACDGTVCRECHLHDALDIDPSSDLWGGGGLVATMTDLAVFIRALFNGQVYDRPGTLEAMLAPVKAADAAGYGMGIRRLDLGTGGWWGHRGFWGTVVGYHPTSGVAVATTITRRQAHPDDRLLPGRALVRALNQFLPSGLIRCGRWPIVGAR
jgi:D-alanyl-D-alanine carboxypeptidase